METKKGLKATERNDLKLEKVFKLLDELNIDYDLTCDNEGKIVYSINFKKQNINMGDLWIYDKSKIQVKIDIIDNRIEAINKRLEELEDSETNEEWDEIENLETERSELNGKLDGYIDIIDNSILIEEQLPEETYIAGLDFYNN